MRKNKAFLLLFFISFLILKINAQHTVGIFINNLQSFDGYTLFAPIGSTNTFLIDNCGKLVHTWNCNYVPGQAVYLLPNGNLLHTGKATGTNFNAGGKGGVLEIYDWNSNLIWSYTISNINECMHHDVKMLPNGNILVISWENKNTEDAIAAGRNPTYVNSGLWSEKILEIKPLGTDSAEIVWEWHLWDHLVQQYDSVLPNYDTITTHPELVNINFNTSTSADWIHMNSVAYNSTLDQIILSAHNFNEIWIIDHSTTKAEAASHSGGNSGKGGDLLYRWGNPGAYGFGGLGTRRLFGQHDAQWIPEGFPNAGKILLYNNGLNRPAGSYSTIEIISPPIEPTGNYTFTSGQAYAPNLATFIYPTAADLTFFSSNISGVQPLPNGNLLICEGDNGELFEIDSLKNIVWKYINPVINTGPIGQGTVPTSNMIFKVKRYSSDYSGFNNQILISGLPIETNPLPDSCVLFPLNNDEITNNIFEFNVFPNPAKDFININFSKKGTYNFYILNYMGHIVKKINSSNNIIINIKELPSGIYFIKTDLPYTQKFIVE